MPGHSPQFTDQGLPKLKATPPSKARKAVAMLASGTASLLLFASAASAAPSRALPGHIIEGIHTYLAV